eukprot:1156647-Pelagomonas_calceolata.AAC.17
MVLRYKHGAKVGAWCQSAGAVLRSMVPRCEYGVKVREHGVKTLTTMQLSLPGVVTAPATVHAAFISWCGGSTCNCAHKQWHTVQNYHRFAAGIKDRHRRRAARIKDSSTGGM